LIAKTQRLFYKIERSHIWDAAAKLLRATALSLGESKLPIEALDVYYKTQRCSLACGKIVTVIDRVDLSAPLKAVKMLL
jgi:hypothetical protein